LEGLISRGLAPYAKKIVGVDISEAMVMHSLSRVRMQIVIIVSFTQLQVNQYNLRVENQGIPPEEMRAVCAELKGTAEELDGLKFDVVVVRLLSGLYDFVLNMYIPHSAHRHTITSIQLNP